MVRLAMRLLMGLESLFFSGSDIAIAGGMVDVRSSRSLALVVAGLVLADGVFLALAAWQALRGTGWSIWERSCLLSLTPYSV
jgi:hypothetical protein